VYCCQACRYILPFYHRLAVVLAVAGLSDIKLNLLPLPLPLLVLQATGLLWGKRPKHYQPSLKLKLQRHVLNRCSHSPHFSNLLLALYIRYSLTLCQLRGGILLICSINTDTHFLKSFPEMECTLDLSQALALCPLLPGIFSFHGPSI
jgi:hypothetical protein